MINAVCMLFCLHQKLRLVLPILTSRNTQHARRVGCRRMASCTSQIHRSPECARAVAGRADGGSAPVGANTSSCSPGFAVGSTPSGSSLLRLGRSYRRPVVLGYM